MGKYVTVSTKIPRETKEKMQQLNIKPFKLLRKAIEDEIRKREAEKLEEEIEKHRPLLNKVGIDEIVKTIREARWLVPKMVKNGFKAVFAY